MTSFEEGFDGTGAPRGEVRREPHQWWVELCVFAEYIYTTIFLTGGENPEAAKGGGGSYKLPRENELASSRLLTTLRVFMGSKAPTSSRQQSVR